MPKHLVSPLLVVLLLASTCPAVEPTTLPETWAWRPIHRPALPGVHNDAWSEAPIDRLVLAKLESNNLHPAPPADRTALIRRAYFDLIGLPPSAEEVRTFVSDPDPNAFEKVVDGLLANPHFGERWARHWMDLVRYAEGFGHEFDFPIANAYQYRDYLIRAFNADVPYNQFVLEHLAGDLLDKPRLNPDTHFNESIIGTGFWWFGEQIHAPVDVRQHQGDRIDNQIDVMAKTFLGLTVACARCHDHKFDPIKQKDYYGLFGIVESSRRQEAMLDPDGKISNLTSQITGLRRQGDQLLAHTFRLSPDRLRDVTAATQPSQPLYALATRPDDKADFDQWRKQTLETLAVAKRSAIDSRKQSELFKSFAQTGYKDWVSTGWAFGTSPSHGGQWDPSEKNIALVSTPAAHSGLMASRLKGVLYSPSFILTKPTVLYHVAGRGGRVRLVIDGYRMDQFSGLLFAGAILEIKGGPEFVWRRQAQDVGRYVGQRAHIEISDEGDGYVAVDEVRFADAQAPIPTDPPSSVCESILNDPAVTSVDSLVEAYAKRMALALDHFSAGTCEPDEARLISSKYLEADPEKLSQFNAIKKEIDGLARKLPDPMRAVAMLDVNGFDERVFVRGNHKTPGDPAPRDFLVSIAGTDQAPVENGSGRLDFARRMIDSSDPLLPRVMVNRLWHHLMGRGIVASVDDFGKMGERPSNLPLLDYLADDFTGHGWSIKRMIRQIVVSQTYQMSSQAVDSEAERVDPNNVLLHRANLRRLEAEEIRDEMLASSGRLDLTMFGPSVDVHLTEFMEGRGKPKSGPLDGDGRRSIYLAVRRNFLSPMMLAFDAPAPFNTMGRRSVSNVPAQALMLMNDPFVLQQSRRWADRMVSQSNLNDAERIAAMYQSAFGRAATPGEIERAMTFLKSQAMERGVDPTKLTVDVYADLAHALMNSKEFIFLN